MRGCRYHGRYFMDADFGDSLADGHVFYELHDDLGRLEDLKRTLGRYVEQDVLPRFL